MNSFKSSLTLNLEQSSYISYTAAYISLCLFWNHATLSISLELVIAIVNVIYDLFEFSHACVYSVWHFSWDFLSRFKSILKIFGITLRVENLSQEEITLKRFRPLLCPLFASPFRTNKDRNAFVGVLQLWNECLHQHVVLQRCFCMEVGAETLVFFFFALYYVCMQPW